MPQRPVSGYTLVALIVIVAVMNVLVAAALPFWSQVIKRDREAELIFRGLQYAEAIRVFQVRTSRLPNTLDELIDLKPRSIRRLWKDPMTESGEWQLVRGQVGGAGSGQVVAGGTAPSGSQDGRQDSGSGRRDAPGPIVGVKSRSKESGLRTFMGSTEYADWQFTLELVPVPTPIPDSLLVPRPTSDWIGRPFREGIQPLQGGAPGQDLQRPPQRDDG